jgi:hypothetical protein
MFQRRSLKCAHLKKKAQVSNVCAPPIFIIDPQFRDFYRNPEIGDETELGNGIG